MKRNSNQLWSWEKKTEAKQPTETKEVIKMEEEKYICKTEGCGREISEKRAEGSGLCSKCQIKAWKRSHRRVNEPRGEVGDQGYCAQCEKPFIKTRHDARFCSKPCRDKWGREEKQRKAEIKVGKESAKPARRLTPTIPERLLQGPKTTPELLAAADRLRSILQEMLSPIEKAVAEVKERFAL